jgi:hypothetical protein
MMKEISPDQSSVELIESLLEENAGYLVRLLEDSIHHFSYLKDMLFRTICPKYGRIVFKLDDCAEQARRLELLLSERARLVRIMNRLKDEEDWCKARL